jgi:hypothetical protein
VPVPITAKEATRRHKASFFVKSQIARMHATTLAAMHKEIV